MAVTWNFQLREYRTSDPEPRAEDTDRVIITEFDGPNSDVPRARARLILQAAGLGLRPWLVLRDAILWSQVVYSGHAQPWKSAVGAGVDFRELVIPPEILPPEVPHLPAIDMRIAAAIRALTPSALRMENWHTSDHCGTAHCRAGWAVDLCGDAGYDLEREFGPAIAGSMIYAKARPGQPIPDFYTTTNLARASIERDAFEARRRDFFG